MTIPLLIELLYLFAIGAVFGSFLNVVVDRLPLGQSIITGRSYCDHCKKTIKWIDLIPIISYVNLRGKCRFCHKPIGLYYPAVEIVTGLVFALAGYQASSLPELLFFLLILCSLVIIFFADMKYGLIPFPAVFFGFAVVLVKLLFTPQFFSYITYCSIGCWGIFSHYFPSHSWSRHGIW